MRNGSCWQVEATDQSGSKEAGDKKSKGDQPEMIAGKKDNKDDRNHLTADMANNGHTVFAVRVFALGKGMNGRAFESGDSRSRQMAWRRHAIYFIS